MTMSQSSSRHLVEHAVAQDAGRVDHRVQAAEARRAPARAMSFTASQSVTLLELETACAAGGADLLGHRLGRTRRALVAAALAAAEVVDQHLGAFARRDQRALAPDAVAGAGDQHHPAVQCAHVFLPDLSRCLAKRPCQQAVASVQRNRAAMLEAARADPSPTPWWRPDIHQDRRPRLIARGAITRAFRRWFEARGFVEVETAALQVSPGNETHLHAFATELIGRRRRARAALPAHLAGVRLQEAAGGGRAADLRLRPGLAQPRARAAAPSRVHHAGVVPRRASPTRR